MRAVRRRRGLQLTRTTSSQAPVFDRELKLRHRARAAAKDAAGVAYLREAAAARVVGRLRDVAAREEKKTALDLGSSSMSRTKTWTRTAARWNGPNGSLDEKTNR